MGWKLGQVNWLPAPGRPVVCRRSGCGEAATDEVVQLCEPHLAAYKAELARVLAEQDAKRQTRPRTSPRRRAAA